MNRNILDRMRNNHKLAMTPLSLLMGVDEFFKDFDEMVGRTSLLKGNGNFPPFNIKRRGDEYVIELALAGFSREDIKISLNKNKNILSISGGSSDLDEVELPVEVSSAEKMKYLAGISKNEPTSKLDDGPDGVPLSKILESESEETTSGGFPDVDLDEKVPEWISLYKGIAKRKFYQEFKLPRAAKIQNAKMENGMLCINIILPQADEKETYSIEIE